MFTSYRVVPSRVSGLCLSFVVVAILCTAGFGKPLESAAPVTREASLRPEPASWDAFLLFLLRILHDLYGGDPSEISEGMPPVAAMQIVSTHYSNQGVPPTSLLGKIQARTTILLCKAHILASSLAEDPPFESFLEVLAIMYSDVE
jgi:hypothetical protein